MPSPIFASRWQRLQHVALRGLLAGAVLLRMGIAHQWNLVPDEAFYWSLSRHLAGGYLDHPPMVALLIRLSTALLGSHNELAVRIFAIAMSFGSLILLIMLCEKLIADRRATLMLAVMWLVSPLFAALATLMTPDPPVFFFSACALGMAIWAVQAQRQKSAQWRWVWFGLFCGLALLSKYTAILLPASVVAALACTPEGRRHLKQPGIYLAALMALVVFWPVVQWNAAHDWVSFRYQLHHGLSAVHPQHWRTLGEYVGAQVVLWTPILFVLGMIAVASCWRRYASLDLPRQMLLWSATLPLVFFAYAAWRSRSEINWPAFAYFPLSLLSVDYVVAPWRSAAKWWAQAGIVLSLACGIFLQSPELDWQIVKHVPPRYFRDQMPALPRVMVQAVGWDALGRHLDKKYHGFPMVCGSHEDAGEIAFYMSGQPRVYCWSQRPTAYDYFADQPDWNKVNAVLVVQADVDAFCRRYGLSVASTERWTQVLYGHWRTRQLTLCVRSPPVAATTRGASPAAK